MRPRPSTHPGLRCALLVALSGLAACGGPPLQPATEGRAAGPASARARPAAVDPRRPNPAGIDWVALPAGQVTLRDVWDGREERQTVRLRAFEMSRTEVTNAQYRRCVEAGHCTEAPLRPCVDGRSGKETVDACPLVGVGLPEARMFATWAGGRVPSEAEWQYAATSAGCDGLYPWGNEPVTCERTAVRSTLAFFNTETRQNVDVRTAGCRHAGQRMRVCSHPKGNSAQGLCDLVGNVAERTNDASGRVVDTPTDGRPAWRFVPRKVREGERVTELTWAQVQAQASFSPLMSPLDYSPNLYVVRGGSFESMTAWDLVSGTRALQPWRAKGLAPELARQLGFRLARDASGVR